MNIKVIDVDKRHAVVTATAPSLGKAITETSRWMRKRNKVVGAVGYDACDHFKIEDADTGRVLAEVILV